jgi:hypothetical protein
LIDAERITDGKKHERRMRRHCRAPISLSRFLPSS